MTTFSFSAIVTVSSNPAIIAGDTVTGTANFDATQVGAAGVYTFTGSAKFHGFSWNAYHFGRMITAERYQGGPGSRYQVVVTYNTVVNGVTGTLFSLIGITNSGHTFNLVLFNAGNEGFTSNSLPTPSNVNSFALASGHCST